MEANSKVLVSEFYTHGMKKPIRKYAVYGGLIPPATMELNGNRYIMPGWYKLPEDEPTPDVYTGLDRYREDPDKFKVGDLRVRGADTPVDTRTSFGFNYNPYLFPTQPFQTVAEGGEIFPRRNGGISPREGTPGKDSVRAMLMPGEFVMTTDAVKGLGDGNLDKGIKNMYSVMSKLEKRGKAMA